MKKSLYLEKLRLFKELPGEVLVSKTNLNNYIKFDTSVFDVEFYKANPRTVRKYNIEEICKDKVKFKKSVSSILMLTKTGRMLLKLKTSNKFMPLGRRSKSLIYINNELDSELVPKILNIVFLDKPYNWLKDHSSLACYAISYDYTSLNDMKNDLKYDFLDDKSFESLFRTNPLFLLISAKLDYGSRLMLSKYSYYCNHAWTNSLEHNKILGKVQSLYQEMVNTSIRVNIPESIHGVNALYDVICAPEKK